MRTWKLVLLGISLFGLRFTVQAQFNFFTNNGAIVITGYSGQTNSLTIPGTINNLPVMIGDYAFFSQTTLTNLILSNGVESIGMEAFSGCVKLGSVTIPGSVANIGSFAFSSCSGLTNVVLMPGLLDIGQSAFVACTNLSNLVIPNSVTNISPYAFNYCPNLTSVTIPNGVLNIGEGAFQLTGLQNIVIPGSVATIGALAFEECTLSNVTIVNGVGNIGDNAFLECTRLQSAAIPASVRGIGEGVFDWCSSLTNIEVDALNTNYASMGGVLFDKSLGTLVECPNTVNGLLSYAIPIGVTNIGPWAFATTELTNVTIPNGVTSIGNSAFSECLGLASLTIPASVTSIGTSNICEYCLAMTNINVDPANPDYASTDGVLFDKMFDTLIACPAGKPGNYIVPDSVSSIASWAFSYSHMTNVTIGNSITNIGAWAFAYGYIANVTIPGSVRNIGNNAFFNCLYLTNVMILNGVTDIETRTFVACFSLATATIPASVQSIGPFAFHDCTALTNIYFSGNAPTADSTAFVANSPTSYIPATVYYLPGTTGWTNTFAGLPTAPWYLANPVILNTGLALKSSTNGFGFTISWATNIAVAVEASTNLINWQPVQTNTLTSGTAAFSDSHWTNYPRRYYRLRSP